jgi:hypothetical protein
MLADEVVPIADGKLPPNGDEGPDTAVRVARDDKRMKARIWKAGRMAPKKWGDLVNDETNLGAITPSTIIIRSSADVRAVAASEADTGEGHAGD